MAKKKAAKKKTAKKKAAGKEVLVVASKVKFRSICGRFYWNFNFYTEVSHGKEKSKSMMSSSDAIAALNDCVYDMLDAAIKRTKENRRSTVKPQDL